MSEIETIQSGAELHIDGTIVELDVIEGSEGERALDTRKLRSESGLICYDPGYVNTASCQSAITFIDGEKGILRHRGYAIDDLAANASFLETAYLLIYGEMPSDDEYEAFSTEVTRNMLLPEDMVRTLRLYPKGSFPMSILSAVMVSLNNFYSESVGESEEATRLTVVRLLGKVSTIAAFAYRQSISHPLVYPRAGYGYAENFLHMMFDSPVNPYHPDPELVRAIDQFFILHADHEQNCSTSAVRLVGSSGARLYGAIAAGITALSGPLHGGANQRVIGMLEDIEREGLSVDQVIDRAVTDKGIRLYGFGHRVYKVYDPRALIAKEAAATVIRKLNVQDNLLDTARELEEKVLRHEYFTSRNLYPNVDFYTGIMLRALGLPVNMFTVMFAIGRLPGWISHFLDLQDDPDRKIGRPRQVYTGETARSLNR